MSPKDVRINDVANFAASLSRAGKSDAEIVQILSAKSGLPLSHPCADRDGKNICLPEEISAATRASKALNKRKGAIPTKTLMLAGGALLLAWFLTRKRSDG